MDNLELYSELATKIQEIEMKLDAVILRLEICEKISKKSSIDLSISASLNPLSQYVAGLTTESCATSPANKYTSENLLESQRWHSQHEEKTSLKLKQLDVR